LGKFFLDIILAFCIILLITTLPENSFLLLPILILLLFLLGSIILLTFLSFLCVFRGSSMNWKKRKGGGDGPFYHKVKYKNIDVSFYFHLNCGGLIFAHIFPGIVAQKIGKIGHVFEYCAGPGFIGFNLLANNLCDRLTLSDVNPEAIDMVKDTIANNNLEDKVSVYLSDCLEDIPEHEKWDLVVCNPPWRICPAGQGKSFIVYDEESKVHKDFYQNVRKYLKPEGSILFIEGGDYSSADSFKGMIEQGELEIVESFGKVPFFNLFRNAHFYKGLAFPLIILFRFSLFFREIYFLWSKGASTTHQK